MVRRRQVTAGCGPTASRREFLHVGFLAGLGLSLGNLLRLEAAAKTGGAKEPKAKAVIQIYMPGGMAHQETFDPKPSAPVEYRGEMNSIETAIPGVRFNELLKDTATIADRLTICRSTTHTEADHGRGTHNMFTGYRPSPALVYPSMGSIVSHEYGPKNEMPPYVCIPNLPTQFANLCDGVIAPSESIARLIRRRGVTVPIKVVPTGIDVESFARAVGAGFRAKTSSWFCPMCNVRSTRMSIPSARIRSATSSGARPVMLSQRSACC